MAIHDDDIDYFTKKQAAKYLRLSIKDLKKLNSLGKGPPYTQVGKKKIYRIDDLNTYFLSRSILQFMS